MTKKGIHVPQPEFSNWIITRRQELNLAPHDLYERIGFHISERTVKYLMDGKKDSFSEHTLSRIASALQINYSELLEKIKDLSSKRSTPNIVPKKSRSK